MIIYAPEYRVLKRRDLIKEIKHLENSFNISTARWT